jgi:hypothetical protein
MALSSKYYTGPVNNVEWATGTRRLGYRYIVHGYNDMRPSPSGALVRGVSFESGGASGGGIVDINDDVEVISLASNAADRWHLVGIRRTWGATNASEFDSIIGTAVRQLPTRPTTAGTEDFHPIALCFVPGGGAAVTEVLDLRLISDNSGIMVAADPDAGDLIRGFMATAGTQIRVGTIDWTRVLNGATLAWSSYNHVPTEITGTGAFSGGPGSGWSRRSAGSLLVRNGKHRFFVGVSDKAGAQAVTNSNGGLPADELVGVIGDADKPASSLTVPLTCRTTGDAGGVFGGNAFLYGSSGNIYLSSGAPNVNIRTVVVSGSWYVP